MGWDGAIAHLRAAGGVGSVTAAAAAGGLARSTVERRARREGWDRPFPGTVVLPGCALDAVTRAAAAVASIGPPVAVTGWSAVHLLGRTRSAPTRLQLVVPASRRTGAATGLDVRRSRTYPADTIRHVRGLPCVPPQRLVVDLARDVEVDVLRSLVIDLVQRRELTLQALSAALEAAAPVRGGARVRAVLAELGRVGRVDSPLELRFRRRLVADGIELDPGQVPVAGVDGRVRHLDLGIARLRFGLEVESMLAHSTRTQLRDDVRRSNAVATAPEGWRVLRATAEDLREPAWEVLLTTVRTVIAQQTRRCG